MPGMTPRQVNAICERLEHGITYKAKNNTVKLACHAAYTSHRLTFFYGIFVYFTSAATVV